MIFGHKIPQKLFCKNTSEDKETQKLEMGGCRRDSLPCALKLKPIFSPDFALFVLHKEETFTFRYHSAYYKMEKQAPVDFPIDFEF